MVRPASAACAPRASTLLVPAAITVSHAPRSALPIRFHLHVIRPVDPFTDAAFATLISRRLTFICTCPIHGRLHTPQVCRSTAHRAVDGALLPLEPICLMSAKLADVIDATLAREIVAQIRLSTHLTASRSRAAICRDGMSAGPAGGSPAALLAGCTVSHEPRGAMSR